MAEPNDQERVALLCERLGLPEGALPIPLAIEALRHGSFVHERRLAGEQVRSNERLEFLGDAVLDLAVSVRCYQLFPDVEEGALTRLRAAIVNEDALALAARRVNLGELLLLGRGEERTGGRDKQSLLADTLEAIVAAVYLGCGAEKAAACVDRLLAPLFDGALAGSLGRDHKTILQEMAQGTHRSSPLYRVVDAPGPQHARVFEVEVTLLGDALGRGSGRTKKEAEQAAARAALETLATRALAPPPEPIPEPIPEPARGLVEPLPATELKDDPAPD